MAGFDCSTQYSRSGKRLDLLATTQHDRFVREDYARLKQLGIRTVRDGIRWHLVEPAPGQYDFSSVLPMVRAAREIKVQVIYDLAHYGWPDGIDIFSAEFVTRFSNYVRAVAHFLTGESDQVPWVVPINEISFWSWGAADAACLYPFLRGRAWELKKQLVRAAIEGTNAIWGVNRQARIFHIDPIIYVTHHPFRPQDHDAAEARRLGMYDAWDMLSGRLAPELGGGPEYLDVIGLNFYPHNEWIQESNETILRGHPLYRPLVEMLREVYERYRRPIFLSETGAQDDYRAGWLAYIGEQVRTAIAAGIPIEGVCLYPILNYPGWDDDRHVQHGLWDYADASGERPLYEPLARELQRQQRLMNQFHGMRSMPWIQLPTG